MARDGGDRLVYSSEQGRMCPECGRTEARCRCRGKSAWRASRHASGRGRREERRHRPSRPIDEGPQGQDRLDRNRIARRRGHAPKPRWRPQAQVRNRGRPQGRRDRDPGRPPGHARRGARSPRIHGQESGRLAVGTQRAIRPLGGGPWICPPRRSGGAHRSHTARQATGAAVEPHLEAREATASGAVRVSAKPTPQASSRVSAK